MAIVGSLCHPPFTYISNIRKPIVINFIDASGSITYDDKVFGLIGLDLWLLWQH